MTLAERFARVQQKTQEPSRLSELEEFKALSFDEQCNTEVTFGKTHSGKKFLHVWHQEPRWLQWVLKTYEGSQKLDHLKLFHFVQVMLEQEEKGLTPKTTIAKSKPKAMAKSSNQLPEPEVPAEILLQVPDDDEELWDLADSHQAQDETIDALQARMLNLENAVTEILTLLRPHQ